MKKQIETLLKENVPNVQVMVLSNDYNSVNSLINQFRKQNYVNFHLNFLMFNSDKEAKIKKEHYTIYKIKENYGFAGNHNLLFDQLDYKRDYLLLLNDDVEIKDKDFLLKLVNSFKVKNDLGVVSPLIYDQDGNLSNKPGKLFFYIGGAFPVNPLYEENYDYTSGCCWLIKSGVFRKTKFNSRYFCYKEEIDLGIRIKNLGYKFSICMHTYLEHEKEKTSSDLVNRYYLEERNAWFLLREHGTSFQKFVYNIYCYTYKLIKSKKKNTLLKAIKDGKKTKLR